MTNQLLDDHQLDQWALERSYHSERLELRKEPIFESVDEFARYARVMLEEHRHQSYGVQSAAGDVIDTLELGARVQVTPQPHRYEHRLHPHIYHAALIRQILQDATATAAPRGEDVDIWAHAHILGRSYRDIASDTEIKKSAIQNRVQSGEAYIEHELTKRGMIGAPNRERQRRQRKKVLVHRLTA